MEKTKKKHWIRIGTIFGVLVLLIGLAYAWITLTIEGEKEHVLKVGSLELVLDESSEAINIEKAIPISDSEGQNLTGFTFTLENTGVLDSDYTIYLDDTELQEGETRLADSNIKFSLEKNGEAGTPTLLSETGENPNRILDTGSLKKQWIRIGTIFGVLVLLIGLAYAWITLTIQGQKEHVLKVGSLELVLDESSEAINIEKAIPISDSEGQVLTGFTFTLENTGVLDSDYTIYLDDTELQEGEIRLADSNIKFSLEENGTVGTPTLLSETGENPNRILDTGSLKRQEKNTYTLRIWLADTSSGDIAGQVMRVKLRVEAIQAQGYKDASGANEPVLADNMIPVVYSETNTRWEKADTTKEWYNYSNQMWANAVTVTDASRSTYQNANAGEEVKMDDILQMYVWIPRYSYTIKSEDGTNYYGKKEEGREDTPTKSLPGEIDVRFIPSSTKEDGSVQYTGTTEASGWFTPPGFTFGDKELSGLWVGKFETGYMGATSVNDTQEDTEEPNKAIIKPNVYSWQGIRVSTLDLVSRGVVSSGNIYGFDATYDSHAMKNTEWALVAYLTQSKYGKYGNSMYTGANKEIYINNNSSYLTGCSGGTPNSLSTVSTCNQYDVITDRGSGKGALGAGASTTGTIYGIYDMIGEAWEYVMGNYNNYSGQSSSDNSGYTGTYGPTSEARPWPESKYYDLYTTDNENTACGGSACKGHALNEVAGWYSDYAYMVYDNSPWFSRNGYSLNSANAGVFSFNNNIGNAGGGITFRIVLTP